MKRKLALMILAALCLALCGCCFSHQWKDATCLEPQICAKCGEIQGEALGHRWQAATCTQPKSCVRCGITEGVTAVHEWQSATCARRAYCSLCGAEEGQPLEHTWVEATQYAARTCAVCGALDGAAQNYFGDNGLHVEPLMFYRAEAMGIVYDSDAVSDQVVVPAVYEIDSWTMAETETGIQMKPVITCRMPLTFTQEKMYNSLFDWIFLFDIHSGELLDLYEVDLTLPQTILVQDTAYDLHLAEADQWITGEPRYNDDGSVTVEMTHKHSFVFDLPKDYAGLVIGIPQLKAFSPYHPGLTAELEKGFMPVSFAKFPELFGEVQFFRLSPTDPQVVKE